MNAPVLFIVHQRRPNTGRIARLLRTLGHTCEVRCPRNDDTLPDRMDGYAGAVVLGGPMSANDNDAFLCTEMRWLEQALGTGKPVLGVCLGAQMLARVLGGTVSTPDDRRCEVGWHTVSPTDTGRKILPEPLSFFQWHGEAMSLPPEAELIATGKRFPVQAWRAAHAVGIQFHPEVTNAIMGRWLARIDPWADRPGAQGRDEILAATRRHTPGVVRWTRGFLERWIRGDLVRT